MELEAMNTTSTYIGDTLFIVESVIADSASETAADKVKRLILGNLDEMLKRHHNFKITALQFSAVTL